MNLSENDGNYGEQVAWNENVSSFASANGDVVHVRVHTITNLPASACQHIFLGRTHFVLVE